MHAATQSDGAEASGPGTAPLAAPSAASLRRAAPGQSDDELIALLERIAARD